MPPLCLFLSALAWKTSSRLNQKKRSETKAERFFFLKSWKKASNLGRHRCEIWRLLQICFYDLSRKKINCSIYNLDRNVVGICNTTLFERWTPVLFRIWNILFNKFHFNLHFLCHILFKQIGGCAFMERNIRKNDCKLVSNFLIQSLYITSFSVQEGFCSGGIRTNGVLRRFVCTPALADGYSCQ